MAGDGSKLVEGAEGGFEQLRDEQIRLDEGQAVRAGVKDDK